MSDSLKNRIGIFDPKQDFSVVERRLPHWTQAGAVCFITWRTWDSLPVYVIEAWLAERSDWLRRHHIDPAAVDWQSQLERLPVELVAEFRQLLSDRWNDQLDACHGACVLRRPDLSSEVAASLRHFDGDRYELTDFVVMPNHVHLLAAFPTEEAMLDQCESWKHYTARQINRVLKRKGRFWQQDGFDHLVRSPEQFEALRKYIAENPCRARLAQGEFVHFSKEL